jgi:hypothetical protein
MPGLDVSDVLSDPDFADSTLVCRRQTQTVSNSGIASNTLTTIPFTGVVTSDAGDVLERLAAGAYIRGSITIHTSFALRDGSIGGDADIVIWQGRQYTVTDVNDYTSWGAGFVGARCELVPFSG